MIIFDLSNAVLNIEGSRIILSVDEEISFDDASWLRHFYFGCGLLLFEPATWLISPNCPGFAEIQKGNWVMRILAGNKLSFFLISCCGERQRQDLNGRNWKGKLSVPDNLGVRGF